MKAALHRARGKLVEPAAEPSSAPAPAVLDAFCAAFNAGQLDELTELLLDTASVEVVGATTLYGREAARRTVLMGMLFGAEHMASLGARGGVHGQPFAGVLDTPPRVELRQHRGSWVFIHVYKHEDGEAARAMTRVELDDGGVARLRNYFYNPELLAEVCAELGVPCRNNGRCWWEICEPATVEAIAVRH